MSDLAVVAASSSSPPGSRSITTEVSKQRAAGPLHYQRSQGSRSSSSRVRISATHDPTSSPGRTGHDYSERATWTNVGGSARTSPCATMFAPWTPLRVTVKVSPASARRSASALTMCIGRWLITVPHPGERRTREL